MNVKHDAYIYIYIYMHHALCGNRWEFINFVEIREYAKCIIGFRAMNAPNVV